MYMYVYVHVQMYVYNVYVYIVSYHGLVESLAGTSIHNAWSVDVDDLSAIFHGNACNAACVCTFQFRRYFCTFQFRWYFVDLHSGVVLYISIQVCRTHIDSDALHTPVQICFASFQFRNLCVRVCVCMYVCLCA
jgi:hypothetical protein